jgi:hypothetical protein
MKSHIAKIEGEINKVPILPITRERPRVKQR